MSYSNRVEAGAPLQQVDMAPLAEKKSNGQLRAEIAKRYEDDFIEVNDARKGDGVAETFYIEDTVQKDIARKNYHTGEVVPAATDAVVVLGEGKNAPYIKCLAVQADTVLAEAQERYTHSNKTLEQIAEELR